MEFLTGTAVVLSAAALTGVVNTIQLLRGRPMTVVLTWSHVLTAVASLVLLAVLVMRRPVVLVIAAAVVAYAAGLGGLLMYVQRRRRRPINVGAVVLHAPFELIAVALCWMAVFDAA